MIRQSIVARFDITSREATPLPGVTGDWATGAKMRKVFNGDVFGSSTGVIISSGEDVGERSYIATERVTCTFPDGRTGSFTVQHGGLGSDPDTWFGHIVPGSGNADLVGIGGSAVISHDVEGAFFIFDID